MNKKNKKSLSQLFFISIGIFLMLFALNFFIEKKFNIGIWMIIFSFISIGLAIEN